MRNMMKLVFFISLVTFVCAAPSQIGILRQIQDIEPDGSYQYLFETENGIYVQEEGKVRGIKEDNVDLIVQGSFLYTSPEGKEINLRYTADENGFHPEGDHLPTSPPIPPAIQRALEWIAAHPEEDNN